MTDDDGADAGRDPLISYAGVIGLYRADAGGAASRATVTLVGTEHMTDD